MMALSAASLIEHPNLEGDQPAFTVHRLVQAAMRARLAERGEAETMLAQVIESLAHAFPQVRFRQIDVGARRAMLLPHVLAVRECFRAIGVPTSPGAGRLFCAAGRYLHARGDYTGAEPLLRSAIVVIEHTFGRDHPDRAMALHDLALLLLNSGHYAEAETLIPQAIEIGEKTLGQDDADAVMRLNNLANLLRHTGRIREAEQHYRHAIAITEKLNGRDHPDVAGLLNNLANLLRGMSRHQDAEACYREAIAIGSKAFGEHDAGVARYVHNLANLLRTKRRYDEAEPLYRQCIASLSKGFGEDYPVTARAQRNLAMLLLLTKRPQEALSQAEAALRAHDKTGGDAGWTRDFGPHLRAGAGRGRPQGRSRRCSRPLWARAKGRWQAAKDDRPVAERRSASNPRRIVRALARDRHVVHVALAQARAGDADELAPSRAARRGSAAPT